MGGSAMPARLVVLVSGNGSNLQAVLDACARGELAARVVAVIANTPEAYGLERARLARLPACCLVKAAAETRREYDARLAQLAASFDPDCILLAGWMRLLSTAFLSVFPDRVINLHPALPGAFPGTHAIERAFSAWQRGEIDHTGVMIHLVPDEGVDSGPVLAVEEVRFQPGESLEQFSSRMHSVEHALLVRTLQSRLADDSLVHVTRGVN